MCQPPGFVCREQGESAAKGELETVLDVRFIEAAGESMDVGPHAPRSAQAIVAAVRVPRGRTVRKVDRWPSVDPAGSREHRRRRRPACRTSFLEGRRRYGLRSLYV